MSTTPSQTVGPYFTIGLTRADQQILAADGVELVGVVYDGQGEPIPDAVVEVYDAASHSWGRCGTDEVGGYRFLVPRNTPRLEAYVFSRGLLRHQLTRIYLDGGANAEDETLVATHEDGAMRFDIRMQGDGATLFFEH